MMYIYMCVYSSSLYIVHTAQKYAIAHKQDGIRTLQPIEVDQVLVR